MVLGLHIWEAGAEFLIQPFRRLHRLPGPHLPLGGGLDELLRDLPDALLDPRFPRLPGKAAQLVELDEGILGTVAGDDVDIFDRDIELVAAVIDQAQAIMGRATHIQGLQPVIAADAVIDMDDIVALGEGRQFSQKLFGPLALARGPAEAVAQDLRLGDNGGIGGLEAGIQRQRHKA